MFSIDSVLEILGQYREFAIFISIVTTFLGKIPSIALEALVSYEFINTNEGSIKLIITIIALILLWLTIKKGNNS